MSKAKTIAEMIDDLQRENESLQKLRKLFDKACKEEFGYSANQIRQIINQAEKQTMKQQMGDGQQQGQHASNEQRE